MSFYEYRWDVHSCGPAYLKHLSPYDLNRGLHGSIKHLSLDLGDRVLIMEQLNHIDKMVQYDDIPDMLEYKF